MSAADVLEKARLLPPEDLRLVQEELLEDWVDLRLEKRVLAGEFDSAATRAVEDLKAGRCRSLDEFLDTAAETD